MNDNFTTYLPYINSTIKCVYAHDAELDPFEPVVKYRFTLNEVLITGHFIPRVEIQNFNDILPELRIAISNKLSSLLVLQLYKKGNNNDTKFKI